jgi:ABC-type nitrate/sulfonate/bicarbonate transport system substrate-binding protein
MSAQTETEVRELWYTRCPVPAASGIAIAKGWMDEEFDPDGISISSLQSTVQSSVRESHFDHSKANSFRQGGNIPPLWARSRGADVRLVGLTWTNQYQAILARPGSGISGPEDLRGRRLGLTRRVNDQIDFFHATALHGYESTLRHVGLDLDDVELVDIETSERYLDTARREGSHAGSLWDAYSNRRLGSAELLALLDGKIDAIYVSGGRGPDLEALLGLEVVFDIRAQEDPLLKVNNLTPTALTASGALVEGHPDLVARYIATSIKAARWAQENVEETRRILAHEVGIAEDFVRPGYTDEIYSALEPSLDDELVEAIEAQKDFLLRHGYIEQDFDINDWIAAGPLETARETSSLVGA